MKQLLQQLDNGDTRLIEVPVPSVSSQQLLVETRNTLVSAGTERMLVEFGRSSLLAKARAQPDKVRQVLEKMGTDGIATTLEAVKSKLETPIALGYCHTGVIVDRGSGVHHFQLGDRVVTNGPHAEYVRVPHTLAARIPDNVSFESAAFTPLAAIALQGVRLIGPTLGETVIVYGLGLIGLLAVQLLRANGCRVIGIDRVPARLALAQRFGAMTVSGSASEITAFVMSATNGVGADAVMLTLASKSDEPIRVAAQASRQKGRIVLVGVTGLNLVREDFYTKELSFSVSCSYGPGRYDPSFEEGGQDYPIGFVRWTEQRNFEAVLSLMADGSVDPLPLVSHRFAFTDAVNAYQLITNESPSMGVLLEYARATHDTIAVPKRTVEVKSRRISRKTGVIAVIGAGNFAMRTLLPVLKQEGAQLHTIASTGGMTAAIAAEKFGFERVTSDLDAVFENKDIDTVYVLTRHDSHAKLALRALKEGKSVFVEKPLALTEVELDALQVSASQSVGLLTVGFNRRFAPLTLKLKSHLATRVGPLAVVVTVNAGAIPSSHWTQDRVAGGGRILGEACHFIDLVRHLVGSPIVEGSVITARAADGKRMDDIAHMMLRFADGSTGSIQYLANGAKGFPKERVECFFDNGTFVIDNWRRLRRYGGGASLFNRARKQDKGHAAEIRAWIAAIDRHDDPPIPLDEIFEVSRWAIRIAAMADGASQ